MPKPQHLLISILLFLPFVAHQKAEHLLIGAGDIADCDRDQDSQTARLLADADVIYTLGDNAYPRGTLEEFDKCFDPTWGVYKAKMMPAIGNHEYLSGGDGYRKYFGTDETYYTRVLGAWRVIVLDSQCERKECPRHAAQTAWLARVLATNTSPCALVMMHHPRYSSEGGDRVLNSLWSMLYAYRVDVVLSGHDHFYERFNKQDHRGQLRADGVRQFVVGTGGAKLNRQSKNADNSAVFTNDYYGVLRLVLRAGGYDWAFVTVGGDVWDAGADGCN